MFPRESAEQYVYPEIEPYNTGRLRVSPLHELYFEESGNPDGRPVVVLHGGPGGGSEPFYRRYFNPRYYRIVQFDQRGAGKSTPHASLEENTTWDLVADIEKLREHLGIEMWQVFGGSWGSTLALAYAETHPERVLELILRGIFLLRDKEIEWFYQNGASRLFPDFWDAYLEPIPPQERDDLLHAYHRRLTSDDREVRLEAARAWSTWEAGTSRLHVDQELLERFEDDELAEAFARIECHYFVNHGFLRENQLLEDIDKLGEIRGIIVQGRYDVVCPMESAWDLHKAWGPNAAMFVVPDAGHSAREPGIAEALVTATDTFAGLRGAW